jgi:hypothetical protein
LTKARAPYVAVAGAVAIIVAMAYTPGVTRLPGFVRGVAAGITAAAVVGVLAWYLFLSDASFSWRMGALGEYWTSEELRRLGRGWTVLNSLRVPGANGAPVEVDHIAVGPGGVVVVQTKLRPSELRQIDASSSSMINTFALETHRQAVVVRLFIGELVDETSVLELLVLWGSGLASPDAGVATNRKGVQIVHGRDLGTWMPPAAQSVRLDTGAIQAVVAALEPCLVPKQRLKDVKPPQGWKRPGSR